MLTSKCRLAFVIKFLFTHTQQLYFSYAQSAHRIFSINFKFVFAYVRFNLRSASYLCKLTDVDRQGNKTFLAL